MGELAAGVQAMKTELEDAEARLNEPLTGSFLQEEVTEADVADIVQRWTGIRRQASGQRGREACRYGKSATPAGNRQNEAIKRFQMRYDVRGLAWVTAAAHR